MISGVVYSESGGTDKTTVAANLGVCFQRMGLDTLVIDLDPQEANLSHLFEAEEDQQNPDADNLVKHLLDMGDGDFFDLIQESDEGVDILPSHDMLENFTQNLEQKINYETSVQNIDRENYPRYELMYELLWQENELQNHYDAVLVDPNARAEDMLYNAIYAMRTLISPVHPAGKGKLSLDGLETMADNLSDELDIEVGLSCVIPTQVGQSNANKGYRERYESADDISTPVIIGERSSMMHAMWEAKGSAFKVVEERWKTFRGEGKVYSETGERKVRDREIDTLQKFVDLAWFIATETFDEEVPSPGIELDIRDGKTLELRPEDASETEVQAT